MTLTPRGISTKGGSRQNAIEKFVRWWNRILLAQNPMYVSVSKTIQSANVEHFRGSRCRGAPVLRQGCDTPCVVYALPIDEDRTKRTRVDARVCVPAPVNVRVDQYWLASEGCCGTRCAFELSAGLAARERGSSRRQPVFNLRMPFRSGSPTSHVAR